MDTSKHTAATIKVAEQDIAHILRGGIRTRADAVSVQYRALATIIADDAADGDPQYEPRLAEYRYLRDLMRDMGRTA